MPRLSKIEHCRKSQPADFYLLPSDDTLYQYQGVLNLPRCIACGAEVIEFFGYGFFGDQGPRLRPPRKRLGYWQDRIKLETILAEKAGPAAMPFGIWVSDFTKLISRDVALLYQTVIRRLSAAA